MRSGLLNRHPEEGEDSPRRAAEKRRGFRLQESKLAAFPNPEPRNPNPCASLRVAGAERSEAPVFRATNQPWRRPAPLTPNPLLYTSSVAPADRPLSSGPTVFLETFGCQMNQLDSELVHGQLTLLGYTFTSDASAADVVLYNTCSVRAQAENKVL
ncbi:MAG: hypothetical protein V3U45_01335, partial [bacterium]